METLNLNLFNVLIISGVLHGIIFTTIVTTNKKFITNNTTYLALVVLFLSLSNLQYSIIDLGLIERFQFIKYIYFPWHWLVLPMFYMYVKKFLNPKNLTTKTKRILIAPFFIVLIIHFLQVIYKLFINKSYEIPSHFGRGIFAYLEFLSIAFNVLLMYLTHKMINDYENDKTFNVDIVKSETKWLKKLIYLGLLTCLCWLVAVIIAVSLDLQKSYTYYPMWIGMSILVYWIGYVGINKSKLLKERIHIRRTKTKKLKDSLSKTYTEFQKTILEKQLYLKPNLKLEDVAKSLKLNKSYLSQLINKESSYNFNDYINNLRVEEAKRMISDEDYNNYTIESIGLESGFNSKSSFFTAFKKFTDTTPNNYKKEVRNI